MIFASDLDQTLIYSKRHLGDFKDYILIEKLGEEEISYISVNSVKLLKQIAERIQFVPVTTRTVEQYRRIKLFSEIVKPEYAIVCNGGTILFKGEKDLEWDAFIEKEIGSYKRNAVYEKVKGKIFEYYDEAQFRVSKICDGFFWVFVAFEELQIDERYLKVSENFKEIGWQVCIQGRKLYAIPEVIDKFKALEYLMQKTGNKKLIVSGDSNLDYSMLKNGTISIVPEHGNVKRLLQDKKIRVTKKEGILAGEEILNMVHKEILL